MNTKAYLKILLADDESIIHETIGGYLENSGHIVDKEFNGKSALSKIFLNDYDIAFVDVCMPEIDGITLLQNLQMNESDLPVVIISGHASMDMVIDALRSGAADFLIKPIKLIDLDAVLERSLQVANLKKEKRQLKATVKGMQDLEKLRYGWKYMIGNSDETNRIRQEIIKYSEASVDTILITGETGTGKEIVAREIHDHIYSDTRPFIAVSCPALPDSLVESEIFGHVKGAFTGALENKAGYFELADNGTLFLDEIADLSLPAQSTLLRVIETRELRRIGGSKETKVNVRVIAACNLSLEKMIADGKFRSDLFYRINKFVIHLLPLRERRDDIMPIAEHFMSSFSKSFGKEIIGFSKSAMDFLINYDYPGNIRELRNIIERSVLLSSNKIIESELLRMNSISNQIIRGNDPNDNMERENIIKGLNECKWNRRSTALHLGIPYSTLRRRMEALNIK
jgi:DNA-binding NtrC family response regulator